MLLWVKFDKTYPNSLSLGGANAPPLATLMAMCDDKFFLRNINI